MRKISWFDLKNGMRVYIQPDRSSHVGGIGVKFGALHDPTAAFIGRAHTLEHMVARETKNFSKREIDIRLRETSCGPWGSVDIWTNPTTTFYGCGILLRRKYLLSLFPVFADMVVNPLFRNEGFSSEKAAIFTEYLLRGEDSPEDTADRILLENVYKTNPIARRIDCDPEHLQKAGIYKIREAWRKWYVPNNMFAVLLGPNRHEAKKIAEQYFAHLEAKPVPALEYDHSEDYPTLKDRLICEVPYPSKTCHVLMGFPTEPWGNAYDSTLDVLAEILEFKIEEALRDQNTSWGHGTYHPSVWHDRTYVHGMFYIWFPTPSVEFAKKGEEIILHEIRRIINNGVNESVVADTLREIPCNKQSATQRKLKSRMRTEFREEVERLRRPVHDMYLAAFRDEPNTLSELIADCASNGDPDLNGLNNFREFMGRVTKTRVVNAANRYLSAHHITVLLTPA